MNTSLLEHPRYRLLAAFTPVVLTIALGLACTLFFRQMRLTRLAVGNARDARFAASAVLSDLKDAETGQRGYLLLADAAYLAPYHQSIAALAVDTSDLRQLIDESPAQRARFDQLRTLIARRYAIIDSTIALMNHGQADDAAALVRMGAGKAVMNEIRRVGNDIVAEQTSKMTALRATERRYAVLLVAVFLIGVLVIAVVALLINSAFARYATQAAEQTEQLQQQAAELEAQQSELEMQNDELQLANEAYDMARMAAEEANEAKNAFLGSMSHELRTPLNAIAGYTDLFEVGVYGETTERQQDAVRRIRANGQHLLMLIDQILDYTGLKGKNAAVELEKLDLREVVDAVDAIVRPLLHAKQITYNAEFKSARDHVYAHRTRLQQLLVNLLTNAVKFTPEGGAVQVICDGGDNYATIAVRDTGIGIPADKLEAIFEPFVQLARRKADVAGSGVGLGLAISRELARSMNGHIKVASEVGKGTTFIITLSRHPAHIHA